MTPNLKKIQELMSRMTSRKEAPSDDMKSILADLKELKSLLISILTYLQLQQVSDILGKVQALGDKKDSEPEVEPEKGEGRLITHDDLSGKSDISHAQALDNLEKVATNRKDANGKREFLLHRATIDYEYEKSIRENRQYETSEPTEWMAEYIPSENRKEGPNPVVSCWVREEDVAEVPNPHSDVAGTWDMLGRNPFASRYKVIIKPGKYELYQEYKGK